MLGFTKVESQSDQFGFMGGCNDSLFKGTFTILVVFRFKTGSFLVLIWFGENLSRYKKYSRLELSRQPDNVSSSVGCNNQLQKPHANASAVLLHAQKTPEFLHAHISCSQIIPCSEKHPAMLNDAAETQPVLPMNSSSSFDYSLVFFFNKRHGIDSRLHQWLCCGAAILLLSFSRILQPSNKW